MRRWSTAVLIGFGSLALTGCGGEGGPTTTGASSAEVPAGAIAVVAEAPDGTITQEDFDRAVEQTAARQGLKEVPAEDDPQYQLLSDAALSDILLDRWVMGEAAERGIEVGCLSCVFTPSTRLLVRDRRPARNR